VEIDKTRLEIKVGYNEKLTAGVLPETASYKGITWISSDESIVRVSQSGEVTAVSIGTAVVIPSIHFPVHTMDLYTFFKKTYSCRLI